MSTALWLARRMYRRKGQVCSCHLQIEHTEAAAAAAASQAAASAPPAPRFAGALDWCEGLDALISALGGVRLEVAACDELRLRITVHAEATWQPTPSELGASLGWTFLSISQQACLTGLSVLHHAMQCLIAR